MAVMCCPAVPEHVGGGWITACYERVTDPDAKCPKCGRPVWLMGANRRKLETCIRLLKQVLARAAESTPKNERSN